jgi:hypothetical protein
MPTYYDDNFGCYEIHDQDDIDFYFQVQRESRWKKCQSCGRKVKLRPDYTICNACAERAERGLEY